jgi:hypothetical protein
VVRGGEEAQAKKSVKEMFGLGEGEGSEEEEEGRFTLQSLTRRQPWGSSLRSERGKGSERRRRRR